ncbi:ACP S-malonyltransferase [Nisaea acidiphila]|uniref:Malonyl CoA-acyl carrier protein transacylase n=1 Tax=Nisaea acidiphila TaxID=1862145 RepID=A0A9J7AQ78_9PROT|nr:ACP S-malonyltransferase [Nisaea acidiphila]UUX49383.1 ACP S-malonyltransferase [Nisaea acidiphila]
MTTVRAFTFPGQGSQAVGMGKALADAYGAAREVFQQVDDALGESLSRLMFEGPEEELVLTRNAQPALMAVSLAVVRVVEAESGKAISDMASYVAGHSLGEYSALASARALDVADAAKLLRLRGEAMQSAVPVGEGAMAALLGVSLETAHEIAAEGAAEGGVCDIANDNADGQVVISGSKAAVEKAVAAAADKGARKSVLLPVSAPFHCGLMAPAADAMAEALATTQLRQPVVPLVANVLADKIDDPAEIRTRLVEQVTGMVRWRESVLWLAGQGVTDIVELGSGKVLTGLAKRIDRSLAGRAVGTPEEIASFLETL